MRRALGAVVTALLLGATAVVAQQPTTPPDSMARSHHPMGRRGMGAGWMGAHPGMPGGPGMMGSHRMGPGFGMGPGSGMAGRLAFAGPGMLLRLRDALDLTDDQVQRLQALQDSVRAIHQSMAQPTMQAMRDAAAALQGDSPDLATYEAKLKEAANDRVQAAVAMASLSVRARAVLTEAQREKIRTGMELMRSLRQGARRMGPRGERGRPGRGPMGPLGNRPMPQRSGPPPA